MTKILIYGAYGFVGKEISKLAKEKGLNPILGGRNEEKTKQIASKLNLEYVVFSVDDQEALDRHIQDVDVIMNCAGPYIETYQAVVEACIKHGTHYLDLTGEIPVYQGVYELSKKSTNSTAMLLPGIGFDVAPTDCLALYLKENFPEGNNLTLAFRSKGSAGLPPGTIKTMVTLIPFGNRIRKDGQLITPKKGIAYRDIPFDHRPVKSLRITWGDVYTAYHSTGIPNIEVYASFPKAVIFQLKFIDRFRKILSHPSILKFMSKKLKGGSTEAQRQRTSMQVYGELSDDSGKKVIGRMSGPEGGVIWTSRLAVEALMNISSGNVKPGYQTPASAFGSQFASSVEGAEMTEIEHL